MLSAPIDLEFWQLTALAPTAREREPINGRGTRHLSRRAREGDVLDCTQKPVTKAP
jgi:hypothetical protein